MTLFGSSGKVESEREGSIELEEFFQGETAYVVGENGFGKTDELVAVNAAVVLEPLFDANRNLAVKAISARINGGADNA